MAEKRKRSQNFTLEEKDQLIKLVIEHKHTILNKKTDSCSNQAKVLAWVQITKAFNASGSIPRSRKSLLKFWEKLKSDSKVYRSSRKSMSINAGLSSIKIDPILERVCNMLASGLSGMEEIRDCDSMQTMSPTGMNKRLTRVFCIGEELPIHTNVIEKTKDIKNEDLDEPTQAMSQDFHITTSLSSKKQPISPQVNDKSGAVNTLYDSFKNMNKKKEDVETLKYILLEEELKAKQYLHNLQLQAAEKDLIIKDLEIEIKKAVLQQIKGGDLDLQNLFGISPKK